MAKKGSAGAEAPNAIFRIMRQDGTIEEYPYHRHTLPQSWVDQPIYEAMATWMQKLTLDQVIELWYKAQGMATAKHDAYVASVQNPDSMVGKSTEYIIEYWRTHHVVNGKVVLKEIPDHATGSTQSQEGTHQEQAPAQES